MTGPVIQPSFAAGELSPQLLGRVDLAKYHVGASLLRNFFVDYRGGAANRQGTIAVGRVKTYNHFFPPRVIPFQFSTVQAYALEFGDFYMRVIMNTSPVSWLPTPGYVLEPSFAITGITQASPAVITAPGHNFVAGDQVFVENVLGMTQINSTLGFQLLVTNVVPGVSFQATDLDGNIINSTVFGAYVGGGDVARVFTLVTPYAAADVAALKYVQNADTMTIVHPNYAPQQLTRTQHWAWTIVPTNFVPTVPFPVGQAAIPSTAGTTVYQYQVTATSGNTGQESLPSAIASAASVVMSTTAGAYVTVSWTAVAGAVVYNIYRTAEYQATTPPVGSQFGFIGSVTGVAFIDENTTPDFTQTPPLNFNPFAAGNNPSESTYFQGRQWFAASSAQPLTFWGSKSGDYLNMGYSQPTRANDSIIDTLVAEQVNPIRHLVPMQSLVVLTGKSAWRVDGGSQSDVVTPNQIQAVPQAFSGCSQVIPLKINYDILYIQEKGQTVRDLAFNFYVNVYTGSEVSFLASHLFFGHQILQWAWAEEPYKLVWIVREDGVLLVFTYLKEQEVYAFSHADTRGLFQSVCTIDEAQEDAVYFVVERLIGGRYRQFTERLASRDFRNDVAQAWFLDCALQRELTYPAANLTPPSNAADGTVFNGDGVPGTPVVTFGGQGYTAPVGQVVDRNGPGTGASIGFTVVGGVITAAAIIGGTGYVQPAVAISDATGYGAVIAIPVLNLVTLDADAAVFGAGNVGDVLRMNGGIGVVTSVPSPMQIIVDIQQDLVSPWPAAAGTWSLTTPVTTISGLDHLNGATVGILADGNVQAQQIVVNGTITLPQASTLVTIGLPYTAQMQSLPADFPAQNALTVQSKRKTAQAFNVRVFNTRGLKAGPSFDSLREIKEWNLGRPMGQPIPLTTGDQRVILDSIYQKLGQVCVQQDNPLPAQCLAFIPEWSTGDSDD